MLNGHLSSEVCNLSSLVLLINNNFETVFILYSALFNLESCTIWTFGKKEMFCLIWKVEFFFFFFLFGFIIHRDYNPWSLWLKYIWSNMNSLCSCNLIRPLSLSFSSFHIEFRLHVLVPTVNVKAQFKKLSIDTSLILIYSDSLLIWQSLSLIWSVLM